MKSGNKKKFEQTQEGNSKRNQSSNLTRLNKRIANAGICSRREADKIIEAGEIKVNGNVVTELGYKVSPSDKVEYKNKILQSEKHVYVLLNKPKGFVTTTKDPHADRTVMDLVQKAADERIYPVGRLDKETTGLLLLTNDGDLTQKLTHPSSSIAKIYKAVLHKPITQADVDELVNGIELEDGPTHFDELSVLSQDKSEVGIQIHSGKNRIIRRMFEHLGYRVKKLDRVSFAGLTKKDLKRGKWRKLALNEVNQLKKLRKPKS